MLIPTAPKPSNTDPATAEAVSQLPEWVRHFTTFPRLSGLIDEPAERGGLPEPAPGCDRND